MTEQQKRSFIEYLDLSMQFKKEADRGTVLMIDGRFVSPETAASVCAFNENDYYMKTDNRSVVYVNKRKNES